MLKPRITFVLYARGQFLRRQTLARGVIRIGRHPGSHLALDDDRVAPRHALIEVDPDRVTLVDLTSHGGLRLNAQPVDEATLSVGDRIELGGTQILVEEIVFEQGGVSGSAQRAGERPAVALPAAARWVPPAPPAEQLPAFTYTLLASGPKLRSEEVELSHVLAVEVSILWGENVLSVAHLEARQSYFVGDDAGADTACDFLIPREKLGVARLPLVLGDASGFRLVLPAHAQGHVLAADGVQYPLAAVRAVAKDSDALAGARELPLTLGTRAELRFGDIVLRVAAVPAGKRIGHGLLSSLDTDALPYLALSALSVGGLLSSMAFLVPPLGLGDSADSEEDRLYLLQQYLAAAAEREMPAAQATAGSAAQGSAADQPAAAGAGASVAPVEVPRRGPAGGSTQQAPGALSPAEELALTENFGMLGLLASSSVENGDNPLPWQMNAAAPAAAAQSGLWSNALGDVFGSGVALSGAGNGSGGPGVGVGVGGIGTRGFGPGGTPGGLGKDGWGTQHGQVPGSHRTSGPNLRSSELTVSGRLPPELIRRVVRQNHARFRGCYEAALMTNPNLTGRVGVRFVIGRDGSVMNVADGGSDVPDPKLVHCVQRAFYEIGFPKPEGGTVNVTYPISFSPE